MLWKWKKMFSHVCLRDGYEIFDMYLEALDAVR